MDIEQLESILGDPADFIINPQNRQTVIKWALAKGVPAVRVHSMSNIDLTNLYHEKAAIKATEDHIRYADMFIKIMQAVEIPGFNVEIMREVAKVEIGMHATGPAMLEIYEAAAQRAFEAMPPRRLEIANGDKPSIILDGPSHYATARAIRAAARNHPLMMVGPAGCGKTTIGASVAKALQLPFYITSTINDEHQLTGYKDGQGVYHRTPFRNAYEFGGVWVADEIDAWDASALLAANSAIANGFASFPDSPEPLARHPSFRIIATANTFGNGADRVYVGRTELDAASTDRFAMMNVDYDLTLERMFANGNQFWLNRVWETRKAVQDKRIRHVVSSRAIIMGSAALADGDPLNEVEEMYLFKGMSQNDRDKIQ